jgi:hypothetical protein
VNDAELAIALSAGMVQAAKALENIGKQALEASAALRNFVTNLQEEETDDE